MDLGTRSGRKSLLNGDCITTIKDKPLTYPIPVFPSGPTWSMIHIRWQAVMERILTSLAVTVLREAFETIDGQITFDYFDEGKNRLIVVV